MKVTKILREVIDDVATGDSARVSRVVHRISQKEVARVMGISGAMVSFLERGERRWTSELVEKYETAVANLAGKKHV